MKIYSSGKLLYVVNKGSENVSLSILNLNGQVVRNYAKLSGEKNTLRFDGTPGLYIVRAIEGNSITTTKVLIQ